MLSDAIIPSAGIGRYRFANECNGDFSPTLVRLVRLTRISAVFYLTFTLDARIVPAS